MNLLLLDHDAPEQTLPPADRRAVHIRDVLRARPGDTLRVGCLRPPHAPAAFGLGGTRGHATVRALDPEGGVALAINWTPDDPGPAPTPVALLIGLPRPQTAKKILVEATSMGVAALHFVPTDLGERSYGTAKLWQHDAHLVPLTHGLEQAATTIAPLVTRHLTFAAGLAALADATTAGLPPTSQPSRFRLDPPGVAPGTQDLAACARHLTQNAPPGTPPPAAILAIGPERGWTNPERDRLVAAGFAPATLGEHILRVETAAIAALAVVAGQLRQPRLRGGDTV